MLWFGQLRAKDALISDRLVVQKAKQLAEASTSNPLVCQVTMAIFRYNDILPT